MLFSVLLWKKLAMATFLGEIYFNFVIGVSCANIYTLFLSQQQGNCFECDDRGMEIKHPSGGGYLGGLDEVFSHIEEDDSDEDDYM
jgi:hypothetical protein